MLRVFAGGIVTETNVFSPLPTLLSDFSIMPAGESPEAATQIPFGSSFLRYKARATGEGCRYIQGSYANATPAGLTTRAAYENLRDSTLEELRRTKPVDVVLLTLHGAMVADGYPDCETDIVQCVRGLVGDRTKIGVLLDPHCDLPAELIDLADVIVALKEYPHIDIDDCADELARVTIAAARGEFHPVIATSDCRMLGLYPTTQEHMRAFVDRMRSKEKEAGILSISLGHGFPWGDSPTTGARTLVVADADLKRAEAVANEFSQEFFSLRHEVTLQLTPLEMALDIALAADSDRGPVVLADVADNPGGGAPGDSTFILRELLERKVRSAAVGLIWDPAVVADAFAAGSGARLRVRLGGKLGVTSGDALDLDVEVRGLVPDLVQKFPQRQGMVDVLCGQAACLTCDGVDIVVGNLRQQVFGVEVFTSFGIELGNRSVLVVKSANHFYAAFAPIAAEVVYVDSPGALTMNFEQMAYQFVDRMKYPIVDDFSLAP